MKLIEEQSMTLSDVVPWARSLDEYTRMFNLTEEDYKNGVISFGDGTSAFNSTLTQKGLHAISIDPIYQFSVDDLKERADAVMVQSMNYYKHLPLNQQVEMKQIEESRLAAMECFLNDYQQGKAERRYLAYALPERLPFADAAFGLGICAHFLLLYDQYGESFHLSCLAEMLRVCTQVRIFPTINLAGQKSQVLDSVLEHFSPTHHCELLSVDYGFQHFGFEMLKITRLKDEEN